MRDGNQRRRIAMTPAEVETFVTEQRKLTMCTVRSDGTIHAVTMYYGLLDGAIAVSTKAKAQKTVNLRRDPRMTCLIQTGRRYEDLRGIQLVGQGQVADDPEVLWRTELSIFERRNGPYSEEHRPAIEAIMRNRVAVILAVDRVVSWDHRKLTGLADD